MFFNTDDAFDNKITVTETAWGKSYTISRVPVGEEHCRVRVEFESGNPRDSKIVFTNDEVGEAIAWLQEYTREHNFLPLFDKFKEVVVDSPFN